MKPIPNWEGRYSITEDGRVYSHAKKTKVGVRGKNGFLKQRKKKNGYMAVKLFFADGSEHHVLVHRLMALAYLDVQPGQPVDHINGDKTDNSLDNLRICTASQNQGNRKMAKNNTSGYKGVCWQKVIGKWQMSCRIAGERVHAWYDSKEEAARAYDAVAIKAYGEFARLNFPNG